MSRQRLLLTYYHNSTHKLAPLPEDKEKAIDKIVEEARVYYQGKRVCYRDWVVLNGEESDESAEII